MTTTHTTTTTYRRTSSGEWVVCGSPKVVMAGATVNVQLKNGLTKTEHITKIGKPFTANGTTLVYGYLGSSAAKGSSSVGKARIHRCGEEISAADARRGFCPGCNVALAR